MLFNSVIFLLFFPTVVALYFILPHRSRWILLLIASYYFYMSWNPLYALLMLITTFIAYLTAIFIDKAKTKQKKKMLLLISLISNLGILFVFKYFNFINSSISSIFSWFTLPYYIPNFKLLLPVGISFYTFQTLSYIIDVYRKKIKPERSFGILALYVSFFPQLVAGPIERSSHLLPQFYEKHNIDINRFESGLITILWGLFKKVVIADRLAIFVNQVYNHPMDQTGVTFILATIFFAFQIFCDFSGYSDIAIGCANILGFDLMNNFDRPYFSKSIPEFWRRWHISLSTWFKDYVYIPLGGNRVPKKRWFLNQFIVFLLSGLWHGANWNFVIWGTLHGLYIVVSSITFDIRAKAAKIMGITRYPIIHSMLRIAATFALVNFAWIFFRANTLADALYISTNLFTGFDNSFSLQKLVGILSKTKFGRFDYSVAFASIAFLEFMHFKQGERSIAAVIKSKPIWLRWGFYYLILFAIIILGVYGNEENTQFIYFQF